MSFKVGPNFDRDQIMQDFEINGYNDMPYEEQPEDEQPKCVLDPIGTPRRPYYKNSAHNSTADKFYNGYKQLSAIRDKYT